jgi:hypothetical protein
MSWREFSHGTGTECIHIMQALCMQGDQRLQSTRLSGMLILCMHGGDPATAASATWQPFITSKDGHVMA